MSYVGLILHNLRSRFLRSSVTAAAVAIGVAAVVALSVLTYSLQQTAVSIMETGRADFTVAQFGASDILNGSIDSTDVAGIKKTKGVDSAVGVYIATANLGASQPFFLEIGIAPADQAPFGVTLSRGRSYAPTAPNEIMLGYRAARHFGAEIGTVLKIEERRFKVVGIYTTGNAIGDDGAMFPLPTLQSWHSKPGLVTLVFVRVAPNTSIRAVRHRVDANHPQLTTMQSLTEFGRADRNLVLIRAAQTGGSLLALIIGASGVMNTALLSFYERIREFGLLRSVGWTRRRLCALVIGEAVVVAFFGAALGVLAGFVAVRGLMRLPQLVGVFHPAYESAIFGRALGFAFAMALLGALYPALKAARLVPLDALRKE